MGQAAEDIVDTTLYPVTEKVGEELVQRLIMEVLRPLVERWLREQGREALVGADQFVYWEQFNARSAVAPDVYVLEGVPADTAVTAWKVWETGVVPSFCFEVVARDRLKDYEDSPRRYAELGVAELVLFDPHAAESPRRRRWHVYRRRGRELLLEDVSSGDRIRSEVLGAWLRQVGEGTATRVRVAHGEDGATLVPTDAEQARQEIERRERAERELEQLRAELERLRRGE